MKKITLILLGLIFFRYILNAEIYKVQPGDALEKIAKRYNTTVKELRSLNERNFNGMNGDLIRIGQRIRVPDVQNKETTTTSRAISATTSRVNSTTTSRASSATTRATRAETEVVFKVPRKIIVGYKVKGGDTLLGMANRFHTSVRELKRINLLKTDIIVIGQNLKVPSYKMEEIRLPKVELVLDTSSYSETEILDTRSLQLVSIAKEYQGTPYRRGGETPYRVDCSGFVRMLFKCFDILLPHSSRAQFEVGEKVKTITVGDLLFFATRGAIRVNHVGIYIGDNQFIHASSAQGKVIVSNLSSYYKNRFRGARRVWEIFAQEKDSLE